ncbi:MAG: hypothetical protein HZB91_01680 [Elusimicrobia bacterium]|nr:hypothetical protein [Elusimicrobiota bacterium]
MAKAFSDQLVRLRAAAGFKTAYQFYHGNGGRRHFPFTYVHYLRLERRGKLPRPQWMAGIMLALRLSPGAEECRKLFLAYLKDMLGTEEAGELILGPFLRTSAGAGKTAPGQASPGQAMRWMKAQHAVHLTPEQFKAVASDEAAYWCSEVLCNDSGAWSAEDIAQRLGLEAKAVRSGLVRLAKAGLARQVAGGRYRSRRPGKLYTFPGRLAGMKGHLKAVQRYWEKMHGRSGADFASRVELVRTDDGFMTGYWPALAEAMDAANLGAVDSAGERTGFFLVETRVRKLAPF